MISQEDLIEHAALMRILGYTDERSLKRWCKERLIPIITIGIKKYILSQYLTQYIENQLVIFAKASSVNPDEHILKVNSPKIGVGMGENKEEQKPERGKAASQFINKIKSYEKGSRKI